MWTCLLWPLEYRNKKSNLKEIKLSAQLAILMALGARAIEKVVRARRAKQSKGGKKCILSFISRRFALVSLEDFRAPIFLTDI